MAWSRKLQNRIKRNKELKNISTFKIGGSARFFFQPDNFDELSLILNESKKNRIAVKIIGCGSNILIDDKGVNALVINLNSGVFSGIDLKGNSLAAGAGVKLNKLIKFCLQHNIGGFEFLCGIPGTLGGAVFMNAGITVKDGQGKAVNFCIGDLIENITIMDYNGKIKKIPKDKLKFTYRKSDLDKYIILKAELRSNPVSYDISKIVNEHWQRRLGTQDLRWPSCGCVFKNPVNDSAGRLIDLCGFKGKKIGGALVSDRHANFIVNAGKATYKDVTALMQDIKREIKRKFNINLEPEIKIWKYKK
jgi:UDP-N-acetylmuramate dehydrogenase